MKKNITVSVDFEDFDEGLNDSIILPFDEQRLQ